MTCGGCIFVWRGNQCKKLDFIEQLCSSGSVGYKERLFLDAQVRILRRKRSCKVVCDVTELKERFDGWCVSVKVGLGELEGLPLVRVVRKYGLASLRPVAVRAFCCYVRCPDQTCLDRGRGRRCVKQKKYPFTEA